jgi:hypothetical protein
MSAAAAADDLTDDQRLQLAIDMSNEPDTVKEQPVPRSNNGKAPARPETINLCESDDDSDCQQIKSSLTPSATAKRTLEHPVLVQDLEGQERMRNKRLARFTPCSDAHEEVDLR